MMQGRVGQYTVTDKVIRASSKTTSFLSYNDAKQECLATIVDKTKSIPNYHVQNDLEGEMTWEESYTDAFKKWEEKEKEWIKASQRILGLKHKNVATFFDVVFDPQTNQSYIFSEYVHGEPLNEAAKQISLKELLFIFCEGLEGLEFIHQSGFIHCNLKPRNLLVNKKDSTLIIADWGYAVPKENPRNYFIGFTRTYAPPELLFDDLKIDERADLYAFNGNMYQCLTGKKPFPQREHTFNAAALKKMVEGEELPKPPSVYNVQVPSKLDEIILETFRPNPDDRPFSGALEYLRVLREIIAAC